MKGGSPGKYNSPHKPMKVLIKNHQRLIKINLKRIKRDSLLLLKSFNLNKAELGILLVNDRRMKNLNRLYRSINKTTDVLSFPIYRSMREIPGDRKSLLGDIVINLHAAKRQSFMYDLTFYDEVRRLLIHGFLHLLGYDHERNGYQEKRMREQERGLRDALETLD